ncbi:unnamed protein product [Cunninghamella echinulata]
MTVIMDYHIPSAPWFSLLKQITNQSPVDTTIPVSPIIIKSSSESTTSPTSSNPTIYSSSLTTQIIKKRPLDNASLEHPTPKKRKIDQLSTIARSLISENRYKRCKFYRFNQQKFKSWCNENSIDYNSNPSIHIINFLTGLHHINRFSTSTVFVYSTAILQPFDKKTQQSIKSSDIFIDLFKYLNNNTILKIKQWEYDIQPALQYTINLGPND